MPDRRTLGPEPGFERPPLPKRPPRHLRVDRVRTVSTSENARMIAGAGPRMGHAVGVDDRHARTGLSQVMRGPGAKDSCADDDHVSTVHGSNRERQCSVDPYRTIVPMPTLKDVLAAHTHDAAPE